MPAFYRTLPACFVLGLAMTLAFACCQGDPNAPRLVAEFDGNGRGQTPEFTVKNDWRLEFQAQADNPSTYARIITIIQDGKPGGPIDNSRPEFSVRCWDGGRCAQGQLHGRRQDPWHVEGQDLAVVGKDSVIRRGN